MKYIITLIKAIIRRFRTVTHYASMPGDYDCSQVQRQDIVIISSAAVQLVALNPKTAVFSAYPYRRIAEPVGKMAHLE